MLDEIENLLEQTTDELRMRGAPMVAALPIGLSLAERLTADLRAYLRDNGLETWRIFYGSYLDVPDLDWFVSQTEPQAAWQPLPPVTTGGEAIAAFTFGKWGSKIWDAGVLHLVRDEIIFARWYWFDPDNFGTRSLILCAAPSTQQFMTLRQALLAHRRRNGATVWQMIFGGHDDPERVPRAGNTCELFLDPIVQQRMECDVVRFFSPEVRQLYQSLGVPYCRGVLLHGPPGNGKTSLIRRIGQIVSDVPGLVLRPSAGFDSDDLAAVLKRWTDQAPAMLVIEDLDWLLKEVNVSTFLNLLDGIDTSDGGLLLIATTNHPEKLDPAINNRPGRFDVVIEVPCPSRPLREQFFRTKLPDLLHDVQQRVVELSEGLSFAHLQEILRLSGLLAIHAGRAARDADDVPRAAQMVRDASESAEKGFLGKPEVPFGLVPRRKQ